MYVINADNTVSVRQIVTSVVDGDFTAVNSGLSAGDRVVIDGTDRLRDGLHVIVAAENGQPAGAPGTRGGGQGRGQGKGQGKAKRKDANRKTQATKARAPVSRRMVHRRAAP